MVRVSLLLFLPLMCASDASVSRRGRGGLPPPPYLHLPVFVDSRLPLVNKEHFSPTGGTGLEPLPGPVRGILLPERPGGTGTHGDSTASVNVSCQSDNRVHVRLPKSMLGSARKHRELRLGTCTARPSEDIHTSDRFHFEFDLRTCGTKRRIIDNQVAYTNILQYDPPKVHGVIRRAAPFTLPVKCYYNRYQYSYKIGYTPKMRMRKLFKSMRNREKFILTPRNAQWERLSPSDQYLLGKPMYFQAEAASISQNERLYVHSCYATPEKSHTSKPQFLIVKNYGCMVESKESRSRFIPYKNNVVRFSVDAFLFKGMTDQLYMHCTMSAGSSAPTPTAKSCNYDTKARRWVELYGSASVCNCCDSNCKSAASTETKIISSQAWKIHRKVKPTTTPDRKKAPTTSTTIMPHPKATRRMSEWTTSEPEVTTATPTGEVEADVGLEWPFGGGQVMWVEEDGQGMKGTAVVEEEEDEKKEEMKTRQVMERMTTSQPDVTRQTLVGKVKVKVKDKELQWPFGGGGVMWVEEEGEGEEKKQEEMETRQVNERMRTSQPEVIRKTLMGKVKDKKLQRPFTGGGVVWVEEEGEGEEKKQEEMETRQVNERMRTSQPEVIRKKLMGKVKDKKLQRPFTGGGVVWVEEEGEGRQVKGAAVVEEVQEEKKEDTEFIEPRRIFENIFEINE